MILLYGLNGHPAISTINVTAGLFSEELRYVDPSEHHLPLRVLVAGTETETPASFLKPMASYPAGPTAAPSGLPFPAMNAGTDPTGATMEPMMVFVGMDAEKVSRFVDQLRVLSAGLSRNILKAMLTPTNQEWSGLYLIEHLKEERAWHQNNRR